MDVVRIACTTGELIISNYTGASGLVYCPGEIQELVKGTFEGSVTKLRSFWYLKLRIRDVRETERWKKNKLCNVQKFNIVRMAKSR
jgi:hypothetical protein